MREDILFRLIDKPIDTFCHFDLDFIWSHFDLRKDLLLKDTYLLLHLRENTYHRYETLTLG